MGRTRKQKERKNEIKQRRKDKLNIGENIAAEDFTMTPTFREGLIYRIQPEPYNSQDDTVKPELSQEDLDFISIAITHPLVWADFISQSNRGTKFRNIEQYEKFICLLNKYNGTTIKLSHKSSLKGKELDDLIIRTMLESDELSLVERKILESKLPKQIERD